MDNSSLTHGFFNSFKDDKLSFAYMGFLSNQLVVSAINLIEQHLYEDQNFKRLRRKLSFLMIESFQNIIRYGDEPLNKDLIYRKEMFLVRNIGNTFYIGSTNLIENTKIQYVKSKLDEVNELDGDDLHSLYRKILTNNKFTEAGGAGLGFIEMARKTNQKLVFDFEKIDDANSYFNLLLKVKSENEPSSPEGDININWFKNFHTLMCEKDLILMHKGNFSPVVVDPVIFIVENNIRAKGINVQKITFNVILEALQNLSQHSLSKHDEKEAIFIIGKKSKKHFISTGNFIKNTKVSILETQLKQILLLPESDLKSLHDEIIHQKKTDMSHKIGLGLIEIALECNKMFSYHFLKINNKISFYTFDVLV